MEGGRNARTAYTKPSFSVAAYVTGGSRVLGYIRVSTAEQGDSGLGLEAQRQAIRAECERRAWTLVEIHEDAGASGKSLKGRPALRDALERLKRGEVDGIVVAKLDRLSRSLLDFAGLMERAQAEGWNLVALDLGIDLSTPAGEFMANVMASAAQWERRIISQRTKDALAVKRASGVRLGRPVDVSRKTTAVILRQRRSGKSLQAIADRLNTHQVPTPRGGLEWRPSTVAAIVRRISRVDCVQRPEGKLRHDQRVDGSTLSVGPRLGLYRVAGLDVPERRFGRNNRQAGELDLDDQLLRLRYPADLGAFRKVFG
jgi:DNA invertase Pin-like site-specific DNA recombinase